MRTHPETRLKRIQDIGAGLIKEDIMSEKMKTDMDHVSDRWNKLSQQVRTTFIQTKRHPSERLSSILPVFLPSSRRVWCLCSTSSFFESREFCFRLLF